MHSSVCAGQRGNCLRLRRSQILSASLHSFTLRFRRSDHSSIPFENRGEWRRVSLGSLFLHQSDGTPKPCHTLPSVESQRLQIASLRA